LAEESRAAHEQFRVADQKLAERIDSLVSAIGEMLHLPVADNVIRTTPFGPGLTRLSNQSDIE
jgi:hypothetical protein